MFHSLVVSAALMIAGLAGGPAPDRIAYSGTGNGWTGGRTTWSIDRSGRGRYESTERGRQVSGRFDAGAEGFERVRGLLASLEGLDEMPCEGGGVTDQGNGGLTWHRGGEHATLQLDFGCEPGRDAEAWTRFGEASTLIEQWASER
jgi:hypothetical protein